MRRPAKLIIEDYKANPQKAIEQVEWCDYENQAGVLKNNLAWIAIKELLNQSKQN